MSLPLAVLEILRNYRTCELTTLSKDGAPVTWPLCARLLDDGRWLPGSRPSLRRSARSNYVPGPPWEVDPFDCATNGQ